MIQELITKWSEFNNWVIENIPNYTDNDFTFNNFMTWLDGENTAPIEDSRIYP